MMGPHGEFDEDDDDMMCMPDLTSMRVRAFTDLLKTANSIRDAKLKSEAILMLQTVRSTIHIPPRGMLIAFTGGKTETANDDATDEFAVGSGKLEKAVAPPPPKKAPARPRTKK